MSPKPNVGTMATETNESEVVASGVTRSSRRLVYEASRGRQREVPNTCHRHVLVRRQCSLF